MKWAMYKKSPQLPLIVSRRNMAQTNLTDDENQKPLRELWCSAEFIRGVDCELIFLSAVNIFLSITAFLGNSLILVALHKETSLHPPSKLLYRNLAITDLCVGITGQPLNVTYWISVVTERWNSNICYNYGSLRTSGITFLRLYFVFSVFINIYCNKRGQTSRVVAGAQIQTRCNFETNIYSRNRFLDCVHCRFVNFILEPSYNFMVSIHRYSSVSGHHNLRLHQNFLFSAS